ncbi:TatD family hydrolase [Oscillochloris sp. ZM17-4]|uniref:TatD family hydrolase n=1 Tax=Oscillochloris sp. ZM17-4 TaxID=2866714 RepID=UPI001C7385F0|nr:TatD family hydrolase [Oscillochloris sp. ZM17-4]MBX0327900.1 TatD family hydrolase [Oscillochloris sp. ZM17-4]
MPSEIRLIDTHAHVASGQFDADRAEVLARAAEAGVARIIEIGYDLPSSRAALALAEAHPQIYAVVGLQPNHVHEAPEGWQDELRAMAARPKVVGIGEIGMDYHWMKAAPADQERFFREQLAMARQLRLPVVIHSREAQDDTLRILGDAARGQPGIMHSFSGDWEYARACLEIGFLLSFSGPLTFPKATELHEAARLAPLEMLLTETDSPYLSPHPQRGKRNEPARVRLVAERLAALRDLPLDAVADQVWQNAERIFPM